MSEPTRTSPLGHRAPLDSGDGKARLTEKPFLGLLQLRGAPAVIAEAVETTTGATLTNSPNTSTGRNGISLMPLGPDEWIVRTPAGEGRDIFAAIDEALTGTHHQLVDVGAYYTTIEIAGARARDLLAKIAIVDLHPRAFGPGDGVASVFAKAAGWLIMTRGDDVDDGPAFELITRRSHADYLWCLLAESGREWGLASQQPIGREKLHLPHLAGC